MEYFRKSYYKSQIGEIKGKPEQCVLFMGQRLGCHLSFPNWYLDLLHFWISSQEIVGERNEFMANFIWNLELKFEKE